MATSAGFEQWFERASGIEPESLLLGHAFAIAVCRIESAARGRARDPILAVSNSAGQSSRAATKSMFAQLGYSRAQTRIMQRMLAGSTGGWPGLIRLYVSGEGLSDSHLRSLNRQVSDFLAA